MSGTLLSHEKEGNSVICNNTALVLKNLPASAGNARDSGSIPGSGRSSGIGKGIPLQDSFLENTMGRGASQATVHGVPKSQTWPSKWAHVHTSQTSYVKGTDSNLWLFASPPSFWILFASSWSTLFGILSVRVCELMIRFLCLFLNISSFCHHSVMNTGSYHPDSSLEVKDWAAGSIARWQSPAVSPSNE